MLNSLQKENDVVRFVMPSKTDIHNDYMTSGEFRTYVKNGLIGKLKANGSL